MLICRRPGCGGQNPTKPQLAPPPYYPSSSRSLPHSPTYLQTAQKSLASSLPPNPLLPGVQSVTTPAMWKQLAMTGFQVKQESEEEQMEVEPPQQQPPPVVSPPAQASQNTTEELK
eukprot:8073383-Karenia_brevis.AAC.1